MAYEYFSREILGIEYEDGSIEKMDFGPTLSSFVEEGDFDPSTTSIDDYIQSLLSEKKYYYVNKEWVINGVVRKGIENKIKDITKPIQNMYLSKERRDELF